MVTTQQVTPQKERNTPTERDGQLRKTSSRKALEMRLGGGKVVLHMENITG